MGSRDKLKTYHHYHNAYDHKTYPIGHTAQGISTHIVIIIIIVVAVVIIIIIIFIIVIASFIHKRNYVLLSHIHNFFCKKL